MTRRERLTAAQARRTALAAQGFLDARPDVVSMRTLARVVQRTQVLQIDSVNVLQRAHYLPAYSRAGAYDLDLLHRASGRSPRRLVEYWAHVAAFMPVELWPLMRHRMEEYHRTGHEWLGMSHRPELVASLLAEVAARGPSTSRDLDDGLPRSRQHWGWNWSETKKVLEFLFTSGRLAVAGRNAAFERVYDLPERVLPAEVVAMPTPVPEEAHRLLVARAARSHGVATLGDLADYFRMRTDDTRRAVAALVETGELMPVDVEGWGRPAWLHRDARVPRAVPARALLSPFDPLVWERARTERLFGFRYRIEIYVPAERRVHGYYVLPFLLGERLVARVDLKADRARGRLLVLGAYAEPAAPADTARELAGELWRLAGWVGLGDVVVSPVGDLAVGLAPAVAAAGGYSGSLSRPSRVGSSPGDDLQSAT